MTKIVTAVLCYIIIKLTNKHVCLASRIMNQTADPVHPKMTNT